MPIDRLPVTRSPGMIAPAVAVDREGLTPHPDLAAHARMLVEMTARKIATVHGLYRIVDRLAAMHRRFSFEGPVHTAGQAWAIGEQRFRIAQRVRILHDHQLAIKSHRYFLQRLADQIR